MSSLVFISHDPPKATRLSTRWAATAFLLVFLLFQSPLNAAPVVSDPLYLPYSTAPNVWQNGPRLAHSDNVSAVVWFDNTSLSTPQLRMAFLDDAAQPLWDGSIMVANAFAIQSAQYSDSLVPTLPLIGFTQGKFRVFWGDGKSYYLRDVHENGPLGSTNTFSDLGYQTATWSMTCGSDLCLIYHNLAVYKATEKSITKLTEFADGAIANVDIVWDGTDFVVIWGNQQGARYLSTLDAEGNLNNGPISFKAKGGKLGGCTNNFCATVSDQYFQRFTKDGELLDNEVQSFGCSYGGTPNVIAKEDSLEVLIVYQDHNNNETAITRSRIDQGTEVQCERVTDSYPGLIDALSLVPSKSGSIAVWTRTISPGEESTHPIIATALGDNLSSLGAPKELNVLPAHQSLLGLACANDVFLAQWQGDLGGRLARRIDPTGMFLDAEPLQAIDGAVAGAGSTFLFANTVSTATGSTVTAQRFDTDLMPKDLAPIVLPMDSETSVWPQIQKVDGEFYIFTGVNREQYGGYKLFASRLGESGPPTILGDWLVGNTPEAVTVAAGSQGFVVASIELSKIHVARFSNDGAQIDSEFSTLDPPRLLDTVALFSHWVEKWSKYVVGFSDRSDSTVWVTLIDPKNPYEESDVAFTKVADESQVQPHTWLDISSNLGVVLDPPETKPDSLPKGITSLGWLEPNLSFVNQSPLGNGPNTARIGCSQDSGRSLLIGDPYIRDANIAVPRLMLHFVSEKQGELGDTCASNSECKSAKCSSGQCCEGDNCGPVLPIGTQGLVDQPGPVKNEEIRDEPTSPAATNSSTSEGCSCGVVRPKTEWPHSLFLVVCVFAARRRRSTS